MALLVGEGTALGHNLIEISATAGYRFGGRAKVQLDRLGDSNPPVGKFVLEGSPSFGAIVGLRVSHDAFAYFSYTRQQTTFRFEDTSGNVVQQNASGKLAVEYYQLGGNIEMTHGMVVPYLGASIGFSRFYSYGRGADRLFFAPMLDGGIKIDLHEHVHLRVLGRLPIVFSQGNLYCRDGYACIELDKFSPIVQGELQAGVGVSF